MKRRRTLLLASSAAGLAACGGGAYLLSGAPRPPGVPGVGPEGAADEGDQALPDQLRDALPPAHAALVALDRGSLSTHVADALRQLSQGVREARAAGATVGPALGAALFDQSPGRPGQGVRADRRPRGLADMPAFPGDLLDPARSHGEVLVQVAASRSGTVGQAVERLLAVLPAWRVRWRAEGFRTDNRDDGGRQLARNPFHFTEGFGNPGSMRETADRVLVAADRGEPAWAVGGSYQVVRIIRLATSLWDKDSVHEQERIIGRRRDGRWLDGTPSHEEPNFRADRDGRLTPLDSHVRLAVPDRRNPPPLVRRSYSYDRGSGDTGLVFSCFQRDLAEGFETVQKRLEGEAMAPYLMTVGGGYFFVPPPGDAWAEALSAS
ncbi:Dyp-type peroxidase [Streptomyces sp. EN23]|uniref:Dyp-type peroxidase n=1 Tax=Streptomyces sp. EN23 TaxID=212774 RepID=UPI000AFA1913|nr:Dyp-type peroxidase [Streptomyces sp. EN23]